MGSISGPPLHLSEVMCERGLCFGLCSTLLLLIFPDGVADNVVEAEAFVYAAECEVTGGGRAVTREKGEVIAGRSHRTIAIGVRGCRRQPRHDQIMLLDATVKLGVGAKKIDQAVFQLLGLSACVDHATHGEDVEHTALTGW